MTFFLLRFLYRPGALGRAALSKTESWRAKEREGGGGGGREGEGGRKAGKIF